MDYLDSIKLLKKLILLNPLQSKAEDLIELENKLALSSGIIQSKTTLTENDELLIRSAISEGSEVFGNEYINLTDQKSWLGTVPDELFISGIGEIEKEKIKNVGKFMIRGKNYLNDRTKVKHLHNMEHFIVKRYITLKIKIG
jgi:hypothetical protein